MKPAVVTTAHKGVFFGQVESLDIPENKIVKLKDAQMCIYWSNTRGVLGLASHGPNKSCRIGPIVTSITLTDVTAIIEATPEAEAMWKQQPWS